MGRAETKGCGVTGGGCDPAHCLGIMIIIVLVFFSSGAPHPLEPTLVFSPAPRVGLGGLFLFLFAIIQLRLGPPRRVFVFASPFKVLHLSLSSDGLGQWSCLGLFWLCVFWKFVCQNNTKSCPFFFFVFFWLSGFRFDVFRKVVLGLGLRLDKFLSYKLSSPNWPVWCFVCKSGQYGMLAFFVFRASGCLGLLSRCLSESSSWFRVLSGQVFVL